jgi:hypothetical protein
MEGSMKKKQPNLSKEIIELQRTLRIVYEKGHLDGLKEALKTMKEVKNETRRSN